MRIRRAGDEARGPAPREANMSGNPFECRVRGVDSAGASSLPPPTRRPARKGSLGSESHSSSSDSTLLDTLQLFPRDGGADVGIDGRVVGVDVVAPTVRPVVVCVAV